MHIIFTTTAPMQQTYYQFERVDHYATDDHNSICDFYFFLKDIWRELHEGGSLQYKTFLKVENHKYNDDHQLHNGLLSKFDIRLLHWICRPEINVHTLGS